MGGAQQKQQMPQLPHDMDFAENVPAEVWHRVFLNLNHSSLAKCLKTCKLFAKLISNDHFWLDYARINGLTDVLPSDEWRQAASNGQLDTPDSHVDASSLRFDLGAITKSKAGFRPYEVHPLTPETTIDQLIRVYRCGFGNTAGGFEIESPPAGCSEFRPEIECCFATSYEYACRAVCIDLRKLGIQDWVMDVVRPTIRVSEWVTPRNDCACEYNLIAQLTPTPEDVNDPLLLPLEHFTRIKCVFKSWEQWSGAPWEKVEVEISEYPVGMRYLLITSGGKDSQFWAGNYGPKFAKLTAQVVLPTTIKLHALESMPDSEEGMEVMNCSRDDLFIQRSGRRRVRRERLFNRTAGLKNAQTKMRMHRTNRNRSAHLPRTTNSMRMVRGRTASMGVRYVVRYRDGANLREGNI